MKNHPVSLGAVKVSLSLIHLIAVAIMFVGISLMYLNDNLGVGINNISHVPYEDTEEFSERFNEDLSDIFHYMDYHEIFATDGSIDISKNMLRMTFGPNETVEFSLGDLIAYLQSLGYELTEDFRCTGEPDPKLSAKSRTGYVDWTATSPDVQHTSITTDLKRASVEESALEIMDTLHRYYTTFNRLMVNPTNLHFKIVYSNGDQKKPRETVYTNDAGLTEETVNDYGKYACLRGNSVFYDTNLKSIALNTISALAANNPYRSTSYYMLAAVDTAYPEQDGYYRGHDSYLRMQEAYIAGFIMMVSGALAAGVTLLILLALSGHRSRGDRTITLHAFDHISTEASILLFGCLTFLAIVFCRYTLVRAAHLAMPRDSWYLAEEVLYTAVFYLGCLLLFFSLLRRYKAETLWTGSLFYRCGKSCSIFFSKQDFAGRLAIGFFSYFILNTALISLFFLLYKKVYLSPLLVKTFLGVLVFLWTALNVWAFYLMFKKQAEQDKLNRAVEHLASGETSYQVVLEEFGGREREVAENLNNISVGLETALQEKVKSERLKTDLITNVSHDIKTPLTSIINYVDLIKREHIQDENERIGRYLEVLEQKALRLKNLTEDLVEASKASSGNLKLEMSDIDFTELVYQTNGEFEEKFDSRRLELITGAPEETLIIEADGRRLWRVLENLYNNAYKYAMEGSRVYVDIFREEAESAGSHGSVFRPSGEPQIAPSTGEGAGGKGGTDKPETWGRAVFTIKNFSASPLNIRAEELTERFVRGDVARTTEGSGLGLSIAKSLTELQNGQFEIYIDGDLFKVRLSFAIKEIKKGGNIHAV